MTAFGMYSVFIALVLGGLIGVVVVAGATSQQKSSNAGALAALQARMGPLYNACLFVSGGAPVVVMALLGALRSAPTALDTIVMIVLIGLGMLASFTLYGNAMKLSEDRTASTPSP